MIGSSGEFAGLRHSPRTGLVHTVLDNSTDNTRDNSEDETECHAVDTPELNPLALKVRVHELGHDRRYHDNGQRVEVVEKIVRGAVGSHGGTLVALHGTHAAVVQVPDGDVEEDLDGLPRPLRIANVLLRPVDGFALLGKRGRLDVVPEVLREDVAFALLQRADGDFGEARQIGSDWLLPDCTLIHYNSAPLAIAHVTLTRLPRHKSTMSILTSIAEALPVEKQIKTASRSWDRDILTNG